MLVNNCFMYSGIGYLHEIVRKDNCISARINVIHQFNAGAKTSDDVWIDCHVNEKGLVQLMDILHVHLKKHDTIILQFDAEYAGFEFCHFGQSIHDPDFILHFKGNLCCIVEYFVNGEAQRNKRKMMQLIS